ncbi:translocation protein TolB [Luteitalea pratensis]|uniref:Translocation protein TolB n=1 Tax=Luteitalea pratensis TaxID=1855912 RepID=A0A143PHC1_LUTPR|nr:PD40 domain-containing protein [Luteitalea pratensis]AMY07680.1 translocation protein TolB [Luteitalea pratensis]
MKTLKNRHTRVLLSTVVLLTVGWLAVPHAGQEDANDGFILLTTDRDNPSNDGICNPPQCEDIYVMAPDGSNPTRLTHGGAPIGSAGYNSGGADWSHSKKLIAFQSNRVGGIPQIFTMNLDGTEQQLMVSVPGGAAFPSFSQTGNELCFHSQASPRDIYVVNVHGTGLTNLTESYRKPGPLGEPPPLTGDSTRCDWSPKGNAIAFMNGAIGNQEIFAIDADGTGLRRLTTASGSDANPAFSPKGDLIAFESNRDGTPEIYVMKADGSDVPERLTNFTAEPTPNNVNVTKPTWSPTGDLLAFHRRVGAQGARGHLQVYTMNADGTNVTQITFTPSPGFSGFPSWGKWSADGVPR